MKNLKFHFFELPAKCKAQNGEVDDDREIQILEGADLVNNPNSLGDGDGN